MATLDELELRLRALEQAQAAEPTSYYTSVFSGEEMDQRLAAAGVLGAASTPQAALAALGAAVQENELDNAYFVGGGTGWGSFPVNQRGQAEYSGVAPLFDRWKNSFGDGGAITLTQNGVTFTGANPYLAIRQVLKRALPIGETYSLSILLHDKSFYTQVITVPTKNEYSQPVLIGNSMLRLFGPDLFELIVFNGDTIPEVVLIKLEPGKTQTAAYQKADGTWAMLPKNLDYQQELAKCQAYLWVPQQKNGYTALGVGHAENANIAWVTVVPPVSMRTGGTPTVKISDVSALNLRGSSIVTATGVSVDQATNGTPILLRVEGTFTPGEALDVFLANSASIEFSREL